MGKWKLQGKPCLKFGTPRGLFVIIPGPLAQANVLLKQVAKEISL